MSTICPVCQKDDRIYKVSAVYSGGISHGTFSSRDGHVSGTNQTVLSGNLAPLPKPSISCLVIVSSGFFVVAGILWLGFILFGLVITHDELRPNTYNLGALLVVIAPVAIDLLLGLSIYLLASSSVKRKMPHWTAAMRIWDRCYYCDRDGIVIDPANGATIRVDSFNNYLKKV